MKAEFARHVDAKKSQWYIRTRQPTAEELQQAEHSACSVFDYYHLRPLDMDDMRTWQEALREYMMEKGYIG